MKGAAALSLCLATAIAQEPARESLAPRVTVTEQAGAWVVAGTSTTFTLRKADLALDVQAGPARWSMLPALLEMTSHEFLDGSYKKERTTFADGTTVTVDWDAGTVTVKP